jgi:uncharacterized integral membrane protein
MADEGGSDEVRRADKMRADDGGSALTPRRITALVVLGIVLVLAILNLERVAVDFGVKSVRMPLIVLIGVSAGGGFLAGWLFFRHRERRRRSESS